MRNFYIDRVVYFNIAHETEIRIIGKPNMAARRNL